MIRESAANSLIVMVKGLKSSSLIIFPGCVGSLSILLMCPHLSVIIVVINNIGIAVNELEKDSPISRNLYSISALFVTCQLVQGGTRIIHISYFTCSI